MKKYYLFLLFSIIILSCRKDRLDDLKLQDDIIVLMKSFKVDSISFYSNNTKSYNFRQSLKRKINWNRARKDSLGIYYVPITLSIPRGDKKEVFSNGSRSFPHKVLLVIDPQASEMKYSM